MRGLDHRLAFVIAGALDEAKASGSFPELDGCDGRRCGFQALQQFSQPGGPFQALKVEHGEHHRVMRGLSAALVGIGQG